MNSVTSKKISESFPQVLTLQTGAEAHLSLGEVLPPDKAKPTSLVFATDLKLFNQGVEKKARAFIVKDSVWNEIKSKTWPEFVIWSTPNPQMAMTQVLKLFDARAAFLKPGIHPTAFVHPLAQVDTSVHVGAHATIEAHAVVGANSVIYPSAYIGHYCEVGARCIIGPFSCIGADGFSFAQDKQFNHHKIPQIGRAVIEDDCELGAHCAVDRAALTETRIGRGTKLDNFCHIAHNCELGANNIAAAGLMVAGSSRTGRNFMAGGSVVIGDHVEICDGVIVAGRSAVNNDIKEPGIYGGYPLEPQRDSLRTLATLPQIKNFRKQINKILKHLNLDQEQ